jgi:hypothetical protein
MITIDTIRTLSWKTSPRISEGEGRYQITVEVHPNRDFGQHYLVRLAYGGVSLARTPERAMHYVRQRRSLAKRC